jgi:flagellar biosynthesis component FlhA
MIRAASDAVVTIVKTVQVFLVTGVVLGILSTIPGAPSLADFTHALAGLGAVAQTAVRFILEAIPA